MLLLLLKLELLLLRSRIVDVNSQADDDHGNSLCQEQAIENCNTRIHARVYLRSIFLVLIQTLASLEPSPAANARPAGSAN